MTTDSGTASGTPMCARWYERCGDYRPWYGHAEASCTCGLNVHYPDSAHDRGCLVREQHDRELLSQLTGPMSQEG